MDRDEIELFLSETLSGRYRPTAYLGSGAFSGAFRTQDDRTQESFATKILKISQCHSEDALREFRDEVGMLGKLRGCDRVIGLIDSGQHTVTLHHSASGRSISVTTQFSVLELAAGSLAELLLYGPSFSWPDRLKLYRDVVKGVHQMHRHGIVHRDIKAENGLVTESRPGAKISDLGRSHDTSQPPRFAIDAYLCGRGDTRFAPLEFLWLQGTQEPEDQARADLYLLGSLLFEMATGVALTTLITASPIAVINTKAALPPSDRERDWQANIPLLRDSSRLAYETFAAEVPPAIGDRAVSLLEQLTDPDPALRLSRRRGGHGPQPDAWDLQWLLHRIDGLRHAVDPSLRKRYLASRPARKHGRSRARTP